MTDSQASALRRLRAELGDLVERHAARPAPDAFAPYAADPAGFARDVLGMALWSRQEEGLRLLTNQRLVRVRAAQGVGKTYAGAAAVLWWLYGRGPSAVVTLAPTDRQVGILWREIRAAFLRVQGLPGDLFQQGLRVDDAARHFAVGFATTEAGRLTGWHHPRLLVVMDEAHGLEPWVWEAVFALATGAENKILAIGNPGAPTGRWYEVNRSPAWAGVTISALEHPNVETGTEVVAGAVSPAFVADVAREFGVGSATYLARVLGEFAETDEAILCRREWLERAAVVWEGGALAAAAAGEQLTLALDPARYGADQSALAVRQGSVLLALETWAKLDTMETCGRLIAELRARGVRQEDPLAGLELPPGWRDSGAPNEARVLVDEPGLGGGIVDRLREQRWPVIAFNGGSTAQDSERFANLRAETYWHLRRLLEEGRVGLPRDERLWDELVALRWRTNSAGKIQLEPKDILRQRIGRSPDRADAVAMAFGAELTDTCTTGGFRFSL